MLTEKEQKTFQQNLSMKLHNFLLLIEMTLKTLNKTGLNVAILFLTFHSSISSSLAGQFKKTQHAAYGPGL